MDVQNDLVRLVFDSVNKKVLAVCTAQPFFTFFVNTVTPNEHVHERDFTIPEMQPLRLELNHANSNSEPLINLTASAERAVMEHLKGRSCLAIVDVVRPDHPKLCQNAP